MPEKKMMGRPVVDSEPVTIRMSREMIEKIDEYRRTQKDLPSRPEVVRRLVADWLENIPKSEE